MLQWRKPSKRMQTHAYTHSFCRSSRRSTENLVLLWFAWVAIDAHVHVFHFECVRSRCANNKEYFGRGEATRRDIIFNKKHFLHAEYDLWFESCILNARHTPASAKAFFLNDVNSKCSMQRPKELKIYEKFQSRFHRPLKSINRRCGH